MEVNGLDDVVVVEILEDCDFPQSGGRNALIVSVDSDDLDCHQLVTFGVLALVDTAICAFSQPAHELHFSSALHLTKKYYHSIQLVFHFKFENTRTNFRYRPNS